MHFISCLNIVRNMRKACTPKNFVFMVKLIRESLTRFETPKVTILPERYLFAAYADR